MIATSRPAKGVVHSLCVIAAAAIVCTILPRPRRIAPRQVSFDLSRLRRLQLWGRWLATPSLN